jgi:hypothetical protein
MVATKAKANGMQRRTPTADLYQTKFRDEGPMDRSGNVLPTRKQFSNDKPPQPAPPQPQPQAPPPPQPQAPQEQKPGVRVTKEQLEETNQEYSQMIVAGVALVILIGAIFLMTCSKSDGTGLMGGGGAPAAKSGALFGVEGGGKFAWETLNAL